MIFSNPRKPLYLLAFLGFSPVCGISQNHAPQVLQTFALPLGHGTVLNSF